MGLKFALAAAVVAALTAGQAEAALVVSPAVYATTTGTSSGGIPMPIPSTAGTSGNHFQEVYNASTEFAAFGPAESITQIAFRSKYNQFIGATVTVSNVVVTLSTTTAQANPNLPNYISPQFAANVGADVKTVYAGPITFTATNTAASATGFDYVIKLQTPFTYAKGAGNLLLDVTTPNGSTTTGSTGLNNFRGVDYASDSFAAPDGVAEAYDGSSSTDTVGANTITAPITQFTTVAVVPEPAALGLLAAGTAGLLARRRRRA